MNSAFEKSFCKKKKKEINIIGKIYVNSFATDHKSGFHARRREVFTMQLTRFNAHLFPECVKETGSYLNWLDARRIQFVFRIKAMSFAAVRENYVPP